METISFSYNWNNKLDCKAFTTLRLYSRKYNPGQLYNITLKGQSKGPARIIEIRLLWLDQVNEFIARLDTGYSSEECKKIIRTMYRNVDFSKQQIAFMLLVKEEVK